MQKTDILSMTLPELTDFVVSLGEPKYRAKQLRDWLIKGADFDGTADSTYPYNSNSAIA